MSMLPKNFKAHAGMVYLLTYENGRSDRISHVEFCDVEGVDSMRFFYYYDRSARLRIESIEKDSPDELAFAVGAIGGGVDDFAVVAVTPYAPLTEQHVNRHD